MFTFWFVAFCFPCNLSHKHITFIFFHILSLSLVFATAVVVFVVVFNTSGGEHARNDMFLRTHKLTFPQSTLHIHTLTHSPTHSFAHLNFIYFAHWNFVNKARTHTHGRNSFSVVVVLGVRDGKNKKYEWMKENTHSSNSSL